MNNSIPNVPPPKNEPVLGYAPGSPERIALKAELARQSRRVVEIPVIIGGRRIKTGKLAELRCPHDHSTLLARYHVADAELTQKAIDSSLKAWKEWSRVPWTDRAAVFLKAAELLAGPWRARINAATMLGQSKNAYQSEIDAACELVDFWRFNAQYAQQIYSEQPPVSPTGMWNRSEYRALEGFVFAVTPFNFTSICANLPSAPALMGNVALWKPAEDATLACWHLYELMEEAGLPPGVINFLPGPGKVIGNAAIASEHLAGLHFTGSTGVFQALWKSIGNNIAGYRSYPRIVGETGGKDFVFAHRSADVDALSVALTRGAFEYQGQKCSAASRAYVPRSLWPKLEKQLREQHASLKMGDVQDFSNFINAVINERAWKKISGFITHARESSDAQIVAGGGFDSSEGWFIQPTIILAKKPNFRTMCEEIFGPVLTVYLYPDADYEKTLELCDRTSPYGLTGAIFAQDRLALVTAQSMLEHSAGNFYINDKPTGAVVGQQPFGGGRASGTNDKAGSPHNLLRWVSARTIKETFVPPKDYRYPFLGED